MRFARGFPCWAVALVSACAVGHGRGPYRQVLGTNSVEASCGRYPETCLSAMGTVDAAAGAASAAGVYQAAKVVASVLDNVVGQRIDEAMKECADLARSEVLIRRGFKETSPTEERCKEIVAFDRNGEPVTLAMQMGTEMHEVAEHCVGKRLNEIRPGGFSIEQRYRYDPRTRTTTVVTPADVQRGVDLRGTLVPDVVIHDGNAAHVMKVYDFKFPCRNLPQFADWRRLPKDHPSGAEDQGELYRLAFGRVVYRVQPRLGIGP